MKNSYTFLRIYILGIIISCLTSCRGQSNSETESKTTINIPQEKTNSQIGDFILEIFEDSEENLWFGTIEKGVAKYDGKKLEYFTTSNGLPSNRIVAILEDSNNNLWFGTGLGISKYDGITFTNFSKNDGLSDNRISNLFIDSKGIFWVGTWGGAYKFDGKRFNHFPLPNPKVETPLNEDTKDWITDIFEDSKGNIWFARDGYGVCKYNRISFINFSKKNGLASNYVQDIQEDNHRNIWFGSRIQEKDHLTPEKRHGTGGLTKYDGHNFINFPDLAGLNNNDVYQIYRDSKENLWISTIEEGIYKYNGEDFINYSVIDSVNETSKAAVSFLEDGSGTIWIGCAGGLFRLDSNSTINVTTTGPWN